MAIIKTLRLTTGYSLIRIDHVIFNDGVIKYFTDNDVEVLGKDLMTGEEYDFIWVNKYGKYALTGSHGIVTDYLYERKGRDIANGLIRVRKDGKWGLINLNGEEVVSIKFDFINFSHKYFVIAVLKENNLDFLSKSELKYNCGLLDANGKLICPLIFDNIVVTETSIMAWKDGKTGFYINEKGEKLD